MSRKQFREDEVIRILNRKNDVFVNANRKTVVLLVGKERMNDLGNGSYGKIDFLCGHKKYTKVYVHSKNEMNK